jgi:predicted solute-binding protein
MDLADLTTKLGDAPGRKTVLYPAILWHLRMESDRGRCAVSSSSTSSALLAKVVLGTLWKKSVLENSKPAPVR